MNKRIKIMALSCTIIAILCSISILYATQCSTPQCNTEFCVPDYVEPNAVYDFSKQFNEKKYWLETNERTGEIQICSQRLGIYPEFFRSAKIYCYRAKRVPCPPGIPEHCICWQADSVILCQDTMTGDMRVINKNS